MTRLICLILGVCLLGACGRAFAGYEIGNGFIYLHGQDGWFDTLRLDPLGKGKYGEDLILSLSLGPKPDSMPDMKVVQSDRNLTLSGLKVHMPYEVEHTWSNKPYALEPGHTLGVKFTANGRLTSVGGKFPTWHTDTSGCTFSVYHLPDGDMSKRQLVISRKVTDIKDNSTRTIEFESQPGGAYYFEVSEPTGQVGLWGAQEDADSTIAAYVDGKENTAMELSLVYGGFTELAGDWTVKLDGANLQSTFQAADPETDQKDCFVRMVTPWEKSGYDVSKIPFSRFYTDTGRNMLVQQLKRRPHSDQLHSNKWIYAVGKKSFDVRFNLEGGQRLTWVFEDTAMNWKFNGISLNLDVLRHDPKLPDYYPVFYSSDKKYAQLLTEFYYSHGTNFGVGTPPDWKEWQALILDWTANPMMYEQRGHFTGVRMRPDGYVCTWGADEGWPFPYKDEDKDGKNDYDTRHFTTNSTFILGAYRYFCWTRDMEFLKDVMPKLRKAMAFSLNDLQGRNGIIVINAKGHDGRADGIGSNYWDILPFGHKDAFCNSYYYEALRAMGDLERFCAGMDLDGPKETPEFYEALRVKARRAYNREFWNSETGRYVGCVDVDGKKHDYGFTFVNLEAMAYGLPDRSQAESIYRWMEQGITSSGKADTYSKWIFAPRALTTHNPPRTEPQTPAPSWWFFGWGGTPYDDQCQTGGAILYTSGYDVIARAKYLSADNAYKRLKEILDRYNMPDRLLGGSPLYRGEATQGGPGGGAGSVGVEGEFPESGLAPASFLYAFLGIDADARCMRIRPNLPTDMEYAGVRNLCYAGVMYDIKVTKDTVEVKTLNVANPISTKHKLKPGESFVLAAGSVK